MVTIILPNWFFNVLVVLTVVVIIERLGRLAITLFKTYGAYRLTSEAARMMKKITKEKKC